MAEVSKGREASLVPRRSKRLLLCVPTTLALILFGVLSAGLALAQEAGSSRSVDPRDSNSNRRPDEESRPLQTVPVDEGELGLEPDLDPFGNIEEIQIVGQAQDLAAQDDATSAVGFNQDDLLMDGIDDIRDLSNYTPNLEIKTAFAAVNPTLFIRGVGLDDFNANSSSAVSVYQDGIYMNSPAGQLFGLYDVQSVEILRGPQPTLTNASAGAIVVRSRLPSQDWEAHLTSTFGTFGTREFQGAINVPILPDSLAARVAFQVRQRDGTTRNACPQAIGYGESLPVPPPQQLAAMGQCAFANGEGSTGFPPGPNYFWDYNNLNNVENWASRALVSANMPLPKGQEVEWLFNVNGGQNNSLASQYQHTGMAKLTRFLADGEGVYDEYLSVTQSGKPAKDRFNYSQDFTAGDNYAGEYDRVGTELLDILGGSATATWQPTDALTLQSVTGYFWHDRKTYANDDGGPKNWMNNDYTDKAWQISQETSLTWLWGEVNEAGLGGYYLKEDLTASNTFRDDSSRYSPTFQQELEQNTSQWAVFVTTHLELAAWPGWGRYAENLELDASFRYNSATKFMKNNTFYLTGSGGSAETNVGQEASSWSGSTGELALTYNFLENNNLYVKYSRGWKPGHFNANTLRSTQPVSSVEPETINSYEGGLRTQWFDGLLTANLTGFKYDYENLQVFQVTVDIDGFILRRLVNSESADIWGFEWELVAEPVEGLMLSFLGGYLDSQYTNFSVSFHRKRLVPGQGTEDVFVNQSYNGNRLIASPPWSFVGTIEYALPIPKVGTVRPRVTFSYKDEVLFDPNEGCGAEGTIPQCLLKQPSFWLLNLMLTWTSENDRFEVTGFVRNVLNEEYKVQSFDLTSQRRLLLDVYGTPRIAGAIITMRY